MGPTSSASPHTVSHPAECMKGKSFSTLRQTSKFQQQQIKRQTSDDNGVDPYAHGGPFINESVMISPQRSALILPYQLNTMGDTSCYRRSCYHKELMIPQLKPHSKDELPENSFYFSISGKLCQRLMPCFADVALHNEESSKKKS